MTNANSLRTASASIVFTIFVATTVPSLGDTSSATQLRHASAATTGSLAAKPIMFNGFDRVWSHEHKRSGSKVPSMLGTSESVGVRAVGGSTAFRQSYVPAPGNHISRSLVTDINDVGALYGATQNNPIFSDRATFSAKGVVGSAGSSNQNGSDFGTNASIVGTGVNASVVGTGVNASVVGTGASKSVVGTGINASVVGTGLNASVVGTGLDASVVGTGLDASVVGTGLDASVVGTGLDASVVGTGVN